MPDNQLFQGNKFPGSPFSALVMIYDSGTGLYQLSFNASFNQTYPSDPTTIAAGTPISQSPYAGEILIDRTTGVDFNDGTSLKIPLYTVPAASIFIPTRVLIRSASTSLTTASVSFGFNGNTANDVIANATYTALTGSTLYTIVAAKVGATRGAAADIFGVRVNTAQGGAATVTLDTFGFLIAV